MATATKKPAAKTPGKAMRTWDEELAKRAEIAAGTAQSQGSASKTISLRGGRFGIDGADAGTVMHCIVLDHIAENAWFPGSFDPDHMVPPDCFAFGRDAKTMAPHEDAINPQHDTCKGCPQNEWGSAEKGKGKACKNINRLMLIHESDLEDIGAAEPRMLKVPVTSGKAWNGYVLSLKENKHRPPLGVLTEIKIVPDPKSQFKLQFRVLGDVGDEYMEDILAKSDGIQEDMVTPYQPASEEEEAPRGKGAAKALAKTPQKAAAKRPAPRR